MKKILAFACAGALALMMSACSPSAGTQESAASSKEPAPASTSVTATATAKPSTAAAEVTAAASDKAAEDAAAPTEASTDAAAAAASENGEDEAAAAAASAEIGTEQDAAGAETEQAAGGQDASEAEVALATDIRGLIAKGDIESALSAAENAEQSEWTGELTNNLKALADAAAACNITTEPNSGDTIVYGSDATVVDGKTNTIPFANLTHELTRMQIGFVDFQSESNEYDNLNPGAVELTSGENSWSWDTDASNTVTVPQDTATTWVFETEIAPDEYDILTSVGEAQPGAAMVIFTDPGAETVEYTLSDVEISAFHNMGTFVKALQAVQDMTAHR